MSYCIGTNVSTIKTCLTKNNALAAIERLWNEEITENLAFCIKDETRTLSHSGVFTEEDLKFIDVDEMIDYACSYSFEGDDFPSFPSKTIKVTDDGTVEVLFCTESNDCHCAELTDYLSFAIQRAYGVENQYSRRSECDYPDGHDVVLSKVCSDGSCKTIYESA
jgi:hypothetical protein